MYGTHTVENLFKQLGLKHDKKAISSFIKRYKSKNSTSVDQLDIWTPAQALFLKECIEEDSDWSMIVDSLNSQLHINSFQHR